ncbi:MAG: DNA primase, partial [Myxococcaceae bacterium]
RTIATVPQRSARLGAVAAGTDAQAVTLDPRLERAARDEAQGLGDAPWPPHFPKQRGEPKRVQPSKARKEPED